MSDDDGADARSGDAPPSDAESDTNTADDAGIDDDSTDAQIDAGADASVASRDAGPGDADAADDARITPANRKMLARISSFAPVADSDDAESTLYEIVICRRAGAWLSSSASCLSVDAPPEPAERILIKGLATATRGGDENGGLSSTTTLRIDTARFDVDITKRTATAASTESTSCY